MAANFSHIQTYLLAAQVIAVSVASTGVVLCTASLPAGAVSPARSLLSGLLPFAGLVFPFAESQKTSKSLRLLLTTMRQSPLMFITVSIAFVQLKSGCGPTTEQSYGLRVTLLSVNCTLAVVSSILILFRIRTVTCIIVAAATTLVALATHSVPPFADPAASPLSTGATLLGAAALILRAISFCAVHCAHVLTAGVLLRVSHTDAFTITFIAAAASSYQLLLPWALCPIASLLHITAVVRLTYGSRQYSHVPPEHLEEEMPLYCKESPPPTSQPQQHAAIKQDVTIPLSCDLTPVVPTMPYKLWLPLQNQMKTFRHVK
jgi:hypothetical protein